MGGRRTEREWRQVLAELVEMGQRALAVCVPGRDPGEDAALAQELAKARDWARVIELCEGVDMAPAECVALAWTVDPAAAVRLLGEYLSARGRDP